MAADDVEQRFHDRIGDLAAQSERDVAAFDPPADPPAPDEAMGYLRDGAGQAVSLYVESRTGGLMVHYPPAQFEALEGAMNDWFELYAACYGYDIDAAFTVRKAAELLLDTRNIRDVAQVLTGVPERH
jgi:hypothetical protein